MKLLLIAAICLLGESKAKHFLVKLDSKEYAMDPNGNKNKKNYAKRRDGKDYGIDVSGNTYEVFEGDMILNKEQREFMTDHVLKKGQRRGQGRNAIRGRKYRWTKNTLTYRLHPTLTNGQKIIVKNALKELQSNLTNCIRFEEKSSGYVVLVKNSASNGNGCNSYVGNNYNNIYDRNSKSYNIYHQDLNLGSGCFTIGRIQHEFLHALGLYHAQSRSDRDKYIEIMTDNVQENHKNAFKKYEPSAVTHYGLPYDFESVMHYSDRAFSWNGALTIRALDPTKQFLIGQRKGVSKGDIQLLRRHYRC